MRINHNLMALNTHRQLGIGNAMASKSMEKLSSGLRINRAGDDAAGLAISEKMRAQIRGLNQASRNAQDGISLIQTAEGALSETQAILQRMRELAVQAANDTNESSDRTAIQNEIDQLKEEVNRIANTTEFNTKKLLNGDLDYVAAQSASVEGINISGPITISDTKVGGYAQGSEITDTGYSGSTPKDRPWITTGDVDASAAGVLDVQAGENELTFVYGGDQYEIQMTVANHSVGNGIDDLVADIQTQIDTAIGANQIQVGYDSNNYLTFTAVNRGGDEANKFEIVGGNFAATAIGNVTYTEGIDQGDIWIHGETNGYTTGSVSITDAGLNGSNITIDASNNELTIKAVDKDGNVTEKNITLTTATYDGNAATLTARADLLSDIQTQLDAAFGANVITASFDVDNTIKLEYTDATTKGENSQVFVTGGNAMDELFGTTDTHTTYTGEAANNELTITLDGGTPTTITLDNGYYDDTDAIVAEINSEFTDDGVNATASNEGGAIRITSNTLGKDSTVTNITGSAATELGLDSATESAGSDGNSTLSIEIDGESVDASIQHGTYTDLEVLAKAVESAINNATSTAEDVNVTFNNNKLSITNSSTGMASTITVNTHADDDAAGTLGLTGLSGQGQDQQGSELTFQIGANSNQTVNVSISNMSSTALSIDTIDVTTSNSAQTAIDTIDTALTTVSNERAKLGAYQNRLEHSIRNLDTSSENLQAAESRIRDVDMAKEMMEFTKNNILQQAAQAMLAQAQQQPSGVLQLLR